MKRLLFFGVIAVAIYAFLRSKQAEAPAAESTAGQAAAEAEGAVGKLKQQTKEAIEAGKEAAAEKEAEMRKRFEESKQ